MPSSSLKQHNLMAMVANDPAKAKQMGIPQSVGQEFAQADKGMKFGKAPTKSRADLQKINKPETRHGKSELFKQGGSMKNEMHEHHMHMAHHHLQEAMKHGGHVKKMASGGMTTGMHGIDEKRGMTTAKMAKVKEGGERKHGEHKVQERGHTRASMPKMAGNTVGNGPEVLTHGTYKKGGMTKKSMAKKK